MAVLARLVDREFFSCSVGLVAEGVVQREAVGAHGFAAARPSAQVVSVVSRFCSYWDSYAIFVLKSQIFFIKIGRCLGLVGS